MCRKNTEEDLYITQMKGTCSDGEEREQGNQRGWNQESITRLVLEWHIFGWNWYLYLAAFSLKALTLNEHLIVTVESERVGYHRSQRRVSLLEKLMPTGKRSHTGKSVCWEWLE